jgi:hypothetical protein
MDVLIGLLAGLVILLFPLRFPVARDWLAINPMASRLAGWLYWRHANRWGKMVIAAFYALSALMVTVVVVGEFLERRGLL